MRYVGAMISKSYRSHRIWTHTVWYSSPTSSHHHALPFFWKKLRLRWRNLSLASGWLPDPQTCSPRGSPWTEHCWPESASGEPSLTGSVDGDITHRCWGLDPEGSLGAIFSSPLVFIILDCAHRLSVEPPLDHSHAHTIHTRHSFM